MLMKVPPVHLRHPKVEKDEPGLRIERRQKIQSFSSVRRLYRGKPFVLQDGTNRTTSVAVVLDDHNWTERDRRWRTSTLCAGATGAELTLAIKLLGLEKVDLRSF